MKKKFVMQEKLILIMILDNVYYIFDQSDHINMLNDLFDAFAEEFYAHNIYLFIKYGTYPNQ